MLFGCNNLISDEITRRIQGFQDSGAHPMLLVGIFAELERRRYVYLVERTVRDLLNRVMELSEGEQEVELGTSTENYDSIEAWLDTSNIRTSLLGWRNQLEKMISHVEELASTTGANGPMIQSPSGAQDGEVSRAKSRAVGQRIRERLEEIRCDYDEMIYKCTQSMDGMTLATQLVSILPDPDGACHVLVERSQQHEKSRITNRRQSWNQIGRQDNRTNLKISESNLTIAEATKVDSHQMRKISVLTLVFLPATFVAVRGCKSYTPPLLLRD